MILEQGEARDNEHTRRGDILVVGEERLGVADESVCAALEEVKDTPASFLPACRAKVAPSN